MYWIILFVLTGLLIWYIIQRHHNKKSLMIRKLQDIIDQNMTSISENYDPISITDIFDKVYVIALPKRREYILNSLKTFDITVSKLEIIDPIWKDDIPFEEISDNYQFKNSGEMACTMSHFKALRTFLSDPNVETAVIFEDDIMPCRDKKLYLRRLSSLKNELNQIPNWDILYLGHCHSNCDSIKFITRQITEYANGYCTHALVITRA